MAARSTQISHSGFAAENRVRGESLAQDRIVCDGPCRRVLQPGPRHSTSYVTCNECVEAGH